jgi:para-aminobenzoate synthetase/4-amino-4-deoxychorismate lyase
MDDLGRTEQVEIPAVIFTDQAAGGHWLRFDKPRRLLIAYRPGEVAPCLQEADAALAQGSHVAGFISYEAASGLERGYETSLAYRMPLLWLGVFSAPTLMEIPAQPVSPGRAGAHPYRAFPKLEWQPELTAEEYESAVSQIRSRIAAGYTYQTNFTFRLRSTYFEDPWELFKFLYFNQPSPSCAYVETETWAICSASPELFFALDDSTLTVRPMKGTMPRGRWLAEDEFEARKLQASPKDRAENLMIVDMVRNDLGQICKLGSVQVRKLFDVERYPSVLQMTSTVQGSTDAAFSKIIGSLFPCASVTGAPKRETMKIIAQIERSAREVYTGSIGYITPTRRARFNVAIRTVVIDKRSGDAQCGIGSGVTWDSTPAKEYEECLLKSRFTARHRNFFELLETLRWNPPSGFCLLVRHLDRLESSAKFFGFRFDREQITTKLDAAVQNQIRVPLKVRLLLSATGAITIEATPLDHDPIPPRALVRFAESPVDPADLTLFHKSTDRSVYRRLLLAAPDCYDVLIWNTEEFVTELTRFNVIARVGDKWKTPRIEQGVLNGTLRQELLANDLIEEADLTIHDVRNAESIAAINSVRGLLVMKPGTTDTWFLDPVTEEHSRNHSLAPLIAKSILT